MFFDYLRTKLFEVEDSDTRVEQLLSSVKDLAEVLANQPHNVRCYTLIALDADISVTNPIIIATNEIVKKHWKGIEGKYPEPPRSILRGVILSALYQLGMEDTELCRVIYYTASGYSQFVQFGSEQPVINRILTKFGKDVEDEALTEWSLTNAPATPTFTPLKIKNLTLDLSLDSAQIDKDALNKTLIKAAGADPATGHGTQHGTQQWGTHFASTASAGIEKAIETATKGLGGSLSTNTLEAEINKFFVGVSGSLSTALKASFQSLVSVERRSKLLWWKETLYSTTLRKGYREIEIAALPVVMALDLAKLLPDITPVSVDYLLADTYRAVIGQESQKQTLSELLAPFAEEQLQKLLVTHLPLMTSCGERCTLTAFLTQLIHDQRQPQKITTYTGLRAEEKASPDQLGVIVLHDLLTERLVNNAHGA